jgi:hypothetical protein
VRYNYSSQILRKQIFFLAALPILRWNTTGITLAGISNIAGNASNQLNYPRDAIPVYSNLLYIADYQNNRV